MAKDRPIPIPTNTDTVISIIGPGMKLVGDIETEGTVRIEGSVEGNVRAGKAVVIGKDGNIDLQTTKVQSPNVVHDIVINSFVVQQDARQ